MKIPESKALLSYIKPGDDERGLKLLMRVYSNTIDRAELDPPDNELFYSRVAYPNLRSSVSESKISKGSRVRYVTSEAWLTYKQTCDA